MTFGYKDNLDDCFPQISIKITQTEFRFVASIYYIECEVPIAKIFIIRKQNFDVILVAYISPISPEIFHVMQIA